MYIPTNSQNLKDIKAKQIRLGLLGESGTGKTWSALTFPNPCVADFDGNLVGHVGKDVIVLPFHDHDWVINLPKGKATLKDASANRRDAFLLWMKTEAIKLESDQTLIIDSWSTLQDAFDIQTELEPVYNAENKVDTFAFWDKKLDFSRDILNACKALKCHVVVTFHEFKVRDPKTNQLIDKIAPMMQGKFVTKLGLYFTDFFRCHAVPKYKVDANKKLVLDETTGKQIVESTTWLWQTKPDAQVNCKTRMTDCEMFIEPNFTSLKY